MATYTCARPPPPPPPPRPAPPRLPLSPRPRRLWTEAYSPPPPDCRLDVSYRAACSSRSAQGRGGRFRPGQSDRCFAGRRGAPTLPTRGRAPATRALIETGRRRGMRGFGPADRPPPPPALVEMGLARAAPRTRARRLHALVRPPAPSDRSSLYRPVRSAEADRAMEVAVARPSASTAPAAAAATVDLSPAQLRGAKACVGCGCRCADVLKPALVEADAAMPLAASWLRAAHVLPTKERTSAEAEAPPEGGPRFSR